MFKKILCVIVAGVLLGMAGVTPAYAGSKEDRLAEKVKEGISKLGTGPAARIEVKLLDKTKLKGYVSEAGEQSFVIVDEKTGATSTVPYSQVQQAKGNNLSKAAKIAIGVGVIILPIAIALFFATRD